MAPKSSEAAASGAQAEDSKLVRPSLTSGSSFCFDHVFMRDNQGKIEDFYDVEKSNLGEGSFGTVSRGLCKRTTVERAVKVIDLKTVRNPSRFELEINIQKQLDHPNVVRLYETFRDARKLYLVMELCTGGELFDRIVDEAPNGFSEIKAAIYIRQMLSAINYLHTSKIAHRDVKPENFLLADRTEDATLKIIDFGLASMYETKDGATLPMKTKAGTAYYVAPEVLKGSYGEKCDIWSCGVISFILLCGFPPFSGDTDPQILGKVREGAFEFKSPEWDPISTGCKNLITQMLTLDVSCRPSAADLVHNPWLNFKSQSAVGPICKQFMNRLRGFQATSKLKKVALTVLAQQLKDEQVEALKNTFSALDQNGDGILSPQEVREGLQKWGMKIPPGLEEIFKNVDSNRSGNIDYSEFLAATIDKQLLMQRDVCWKAFRVFDLDGDGKLSKDELKELLKDHVQSSSGDDKIQAMIAEVDTSGDGCIDFEEFCDMLRGTTPAVVGKLAPAAAAAATEPAGKKRRVSGEGADGNAAKAKAKAKPKARLSG